MVLTGFKLGIKFSVLLAVVVFEVRALTNLELFQPVAPEMEQISFLLMMIFSALITLLFEVVHK